jgi:hypothetical protein
MAIQSLEINVIIGVQGALDALSDLQDELDDVADAIRKVDERGTRGINIDTNIQDVDAELGRVYTKLRSFEERETLDIDANIDDDMALDDVSQRRIKSSVREASTDVATMDVDAGVVKLSGFDLGTLEDTLRNAMREGLVDALSSEDVTTFVSGPQPDRTPDIDTRIRQSDRLKSIRFALRRGRERDANFTRYLRSAGRQLSDFVGETDIASLSMSDLHNALARVIPLLVVFIGTLPAVITAMVTLAAAAIAAGAALMALTGFGLLGALTIDGTTQVDTERLQEIVDEIQADFMDAFAPLAEQLEPLFDDALDGLERFFNAVAAQGDALLALTDMARDFGGFLISFVPDMLRVMAGLANAFDDEFGDIATFLQQNFADIVASAVFLTDEALPAVSAFLQAIASILPALIRISVGFTQVATAVLAVIRGIGTLLSYLPISDQMFGALVATILALISGFFILNGIITLLSVGTLGSLLAPALKSAAVAAGTLIKGVLGLSGSLLTLGNIIRLLLATTGIGLLLVAFGAVASEALSAKSDVDKLNDSLRQFNDVAGSADGMSIGGPSPYSGSSTMGGTSGRSVTYNVSGSDSADDTGSYLSWHDRRASGDRA